MGLLLSEVSDTHQESWNKSPVDKRGGRGATVELSLLKEPHSRENGGWRPLHLNSLVHQNCRFSFIQGRLKITSHCLLVSSAARPITQEKERRTQDTKHREGGLEVSKLEKGHMPRVWSHTFKKGLAIRKQLSFCRCLDFLKGQLYRAVFYGEGDFYCFSKKVKRRNLSIV